MRVATTRRNSKFNIIKGFLVLRTKLVTGLDLAAHRAVGKIIEYRSL